MYYFTWVDRLPPTSCSENTSSNNGGCLPKVPFAPQNNIWYCMKKLLVRKTTQPNSRSKPRTSHVLIMRFPKLLIYIWDKFFLPVHFLLRMSKNRFSARAPTPKPLMLGTWNFRYHLVTVVGHSNCLFIFENGHLSPFSTGWKMAFLQFFTQLKRGLNVHSQTWKDNWSVPPWPLGDI